MDIKGKRAIVTGGGAGIGAAIAERLAQEGARVAVADRDLAAAEAVASKLCELGHDATPMFVDVAVGASVEELVSSVSRELGGLDVLVNNAGIVHREDSDVEATPEWVWDLTMSVNLKSVFLCSKYAIPLLERSGGGSIVNIASIVAMMGSYPSQIAYTASKGGIVSFTRELAVILARRKIRVNAICPGLTATALASQLVEDDAAYQLRRLHIPMGRMGTPQEVAAAVSFLAAPDAAYITGQILSVDGGMTGAYLTPPDPIEP